MYNYVVIVVSGYWASCPDTGQHELCKNINFAMETKAKTLFRDIKDEIDFL